MTTKKQANDTTNGQSIENISFVELPKGRGPRLINKEEEQFVCTYRTEAVVGEKQLVKLIKAIERIVRSSDEYSTFIGVLKNDLQIRSSSFFSNITDDVATIEFHHYPFTLYEIVEMMIFEHASKGVSFTTFSLSKEVIDIHYSFLVSLVPLSKTEHELAHSGALFINLNQTIGRLHDFVSRFHPVMKEKLIFKLTQLIKESSTDEFTKNSLELLKTELSYAD